MIKEQTQEKEPYKITIKTKPVVVSLFSGCGGLDLGFKNAGFDIAFANDLNRDSVRTYSHNIDKNIIMGDIKDIPSSKIPYNADVLMGGIPCQPFSLNNMQKSKDDGRAELYKEMIRVAKETSPKFVVIENVLGMKMETSDIYSTSATFGLPTGVVGDICKGFRDIGYDINFKQLNASEYGVPQIRKRIIFIANKMGRGYNQFPSRTHGVPDLFEPDLKPVVTVEDAIKDLLRVPANKRAYINGFTNHTATTNISEDYVDRVAIFDTKLKNEINQYLRHWKSKTKWTAKKINRVMNLTYHAEHWFRTDDDFSLPTPQHWLELKEILGFDNKYDEVMLKTHTVEKTFEQSKRVAVWTQPSHTLLTRYPYIHPYISRRLSVRECARLQTFPDSFFFFGKMHSTYEQIGNAVPVLLAQRIAEKIKQNLLF